MDDRKVREQRLQNERFSKNHGSRGFADRFYGITESSGTYFKKRLASDCLGQRILEIGCAQGGTALQLAQRGAIVTGIDLSDVAIDNARRAAAEIGVHDATFRAMDAEALDFATASFDVVYGGGILHHLDTSAAFRQLARVLAPGGYGLFSEPLGYNPFINLYRKFTPHQRVPDEHPLLERDLKLAKESFDQVTINYYYLSTLLTLPLLRTPLARPLIRVFNALDRVLFALVPPLRKYAWIVVLELAEPHVS